MLNFQAARDNDISFEALTNGLNPQDLVKLTNEMVDTVLSSITDCVDADVIYEPSDPEADDPYAASPEEVDIPWNLGHVIVHITASAEEAAAIASELARGVEYHGRSRYEVPWQQMTTIEGCRQRLEESRKMRLASIRLWPEKHHLEIVYQVWPEGPTVNAVGRFVLGLMHDDNHLGQIDEIVRQARMARS